MEIYKLEAYDKDNDVYSLIMISHDIALLKDLGIKLFTGFNLSRSSNNEPIDWLVISDNYDETPICYLPDETPLEWHNYVQKGE